MTVALNRFHDKNVVLIFLVSAVIGGAFEYLTSWFMQFAFGIVAWDYTGTFLSIDGRTNGMFMAMWGVLGVVWIKLLLPWMLKLVNIIPWNWRYTVTSVCAALMIADGGLTLVSLDCWYQRMAGNAPRIGHRGVLRRPLRQPVHGGPLPEHVYRPPRTRLARVRSDRSLGPPIGPPKAWHLPAAIRLQRPAPLTAPHA